MTLGCEFLSLSRASMPCYLQTSIAAKLKRRTRKEMRPCRIVTFLQSQQESHQQPILRLLGFSIGAQSPNLHILMQTRSPLLESNE